jgi:hypothetical protein
MFFVFINASLILDLANNIDCSDFLGCNHESSKFFNSLRLLSFSSSPHYFAYEECCMAYLCCACASV